MKKEIIAKMGVVLLASAAALTFTACGGESPMTDSRDGKTYKTVNIGDKVWMAENLNHLTDESKCYENMPENCEKNGRLYLWNEAVTACPEGWHLPSRNEFEDLIRQAVQKADDIKKVGTVLKSKTSWKVHDGKSGNGTDDLSFGALPAGYYDNVHDYFGQEGSVTYFWSSTERDSIRAYSMSVYGMTSGADLNKDSDKTFRAFSVRCVKNSN